MAVPHGVYPTRRLSNSILGPATEVDGSRMLVLCCGSVTCSTPAPPDISRFGVWTVFFLVRVAPFQQLGVLCCGSCGSHQPDEGIPMAKEAIR